MRVLPAIMLLGALGVGSAVAVVLCGPVPVMDWVADPIGSLQLERGENPAPVALIRPDAAPLSDYAELGKLIFFDKTLSSSGQLACASCHSPRLFYGPPNGDPAMFGGPALADQGARAVPSLMYLQDQPRFSIGPDPGGDDAPPAALPQLAAANVTVRAQKTADSTAQSAQNIVPQGGLFWDGRADTLQAQAMGPLLNPAEMDGGGAARVAAKLRVTPYANLFVQIYGPQIFDDPNILVSDAVFAVSRYEIESPDFHPYSSKYDAWLEGRARLSWAEMRGYILFNDPAKGDCGACHLDQPTAGGQPPLFTDHQFEALGVPRNPDLAANRNADYFDLGLCGPYRTDISSQRQFCGMFLTPTLRDAATRQVFFHNGVYHNLRQVLDFYNFRDTRPETIYPRDATGQVETFNDLPVPDWPNIDTADPPFDRHLGDPPPLSAGEEEDIIAFLKTLTDGYVPAPAASGA
jgi:cytochrome c peroxidase